MVPAQVHAKTARPPFVAHIRWILRRDMPEVLEIEGENFEFPWPNEEFVRCLRQRSCIGMVAECDGRIVGYMIYELLRTRIHVLKFAVASFAQRLGFGRQMVAKLVAKLRDDRPHIAVEVRETNLGGQLFFRAMGFRAVAVLRGYYEEFSREDAYLMQYRLKRDAA